MARRALLIGIDQYDNISGLSGCVQDAGAMADVLETNEDGSPNYECRLYTSPGPGALTRGFIRTELENLFDGFDGDVLFYFAGHGAPTSVGGFLVTQDGQDNDIGIQMQELLDKANNSKAKEVLLILDCCFSGSLGNPASIQNGDLENRALLREGVTILAASRPTETSAEFNGHGVFTSLVLNALHGGATDVLGNVSAASVYALAEQALGAWDQRPMYKSHASRLTPIRQCNPEVPLPTLRRLPDIFPDPTSTLPLDKSYEHTESSKVDTNVEVFDCLKLYRNARLLRTVDPEKDKGDLYFACMHSTGVRLTGLGRFYWQLARDRRF